MCYPKLVRAKDRASPSVLLYLFALGLGIASVGCWPTGSQLPAEDRLLEAFMEDYVTARFQFYPAEATQAGLPGNDARLGSYSRADIMARIDWLSDFREKLSGLRLMDLSQPSYLDALWLTSLVKAELLDLEVRSLWEFSPSFYLARIHDGLVALVLSASPESRIDALAARLRDIPTLVAQAKENIRPTSPVLFAHGLERLEDLLRILREIPELFRERLPPHKIAELAQLSREATRPLQQWNRELVREGSSSEVDFRLGEQTLERMFLYAEMVDRPLEEIERLARDELESTRYQLMEMALQLYPELSLRQLLTTVGPRVDLTAAVEEAEKEVRQFLSNPQDAMRLRAPVDIVEAPYYFMAPERLRFWYAATLQPEQGVFLLVRQPPAGEPSAPIGRDAVRLSTLRELGGRRLYFLSRAQSVSLLRRVFSTATTREGYLGYYVDDALSDGFAPGDALLRLESSRSTLIDLLRLVAVIRMHGFGATVAEIQELFYVEGYLSRPVAAQEAAQVALDPTLGNAALGRILVEGLAKDYRGADPERTSADFSREFLVECPLPVRLVRFKLMGGVDSAQARVTE